VEPDGRTCESALPFSEETLTLSGDTCDAGPDVAIDPDCSPIVDPITAPDIVYSFTPSENATYQVALDTEQGDWDAVLTMGPICGKPGGRPAWCSDQGGPNEFLDRILVEAGVTYYIVVDGYAPEATDPNEPPPPICGPFTLTFTRID
jgi:hypothetical protein